MSHILRDRSFGKEQKKLIIPKKKLIRIYSRERTLVHAYMWEAMDRIGFKRYCGYDLKTSLFLREGGKTTVWYDGNELEVIFKKILEKPDAKKYLQILKDKVVKEWKKIDPYVKQKKKIQNIAEAKKFYTNVVEYWTSMEVICLLPLIEDLKQEIKHQATIFREKYQDYSDHFDKIVIHFFEKNFPKIYDVSHHITPNEFFALNLKIKRMPQKLMHIWKERKKNGWALFNGKLITISQLKTALKKKNMVLEKADDTSIKKLKGQVAFRGSAKGKVKILQYKHQISDFPEGAILVTEMTSPDFVPAVKRCSAIITDEGGIICHAAIVAREFKIPCIIGTKFATEILHDGDLVEVDAEKGIVKIITKI